MKEECTEFQTNIEDILQKKISLVKSGGEIWNRISSKLEDECNYILLFPDDDKEILTYGMMYLDSFAVRNLIDGVCVCTDSQFVIDSIDKYSSSVRKIIQLEASEVNDLIQLYTYFPFAKNFEIVSYTKPHCRDASRMLNKNGLTKEELIAIGVYKLIPFEKIR